MQETFGTIKLNPKYFKVPEAKILYTIFTAEGDIDGYRALFEDGSEDDVWAEEVLSVERNEELQNYENYF